MVTASLNPAAPPAPRRRRWWILIVAVLLLALAAWFSAQAALLRAQAWLFGYPLVIMDVTREHAQRTIGPENQLRRVRRFPDARFQDVVRPNVDTLYTTAFIRTSQGPWVFEMAANPTRYELMPFMDAWTNVFASPGTRTTGTAGGRFLLVGPGWQGNVPQGMTLLRAPTDIVWLIGRTQTQGTADYAAVHQLQDGLRLHSLRDWQAGRAVAEAPPPQPTPGLPPPIVQMRSMPTQAFFERLSQLMVANPPAPEDAAMLKQLQRIGVVPGQALRWGVVDRAFANLGRWLAERGVARELGRRQPVDGWITPPSLLGRYGTAYPIRAVVAMIGLGANWPADALYPSASVDARGQALHGDHRYRIRFAPGQRPPVHAFWSVTAYGPDDFLIDNPLNRYALGDRDPLVTNADGSLDLWIQAEPPPADRLANWLPVRRGSPFVLTARLYWPEAVALEGRWQMPGVERLD